MAFDLPAILAALAVAGNTIPKVVAYADSPGQVTVGAAGNAALVFEPAEPFVQFDITMARGSDQLNFIATLLVDSSMTKVSQQVLNPFISGSGTSSVKAALEADGRLGGACSWIKVDAVISYGLVVWNGAEYTGARFLVEVVA